MPINMEQIDHEISTAQEDPATRDWLRRALAESTRIDPVDASQDAQFLADLLARRADAQLSTPGLGQESRGRAAIAAIKYALEDDEGLAFLDAWLHGDFDSIRAEWPRAPATVFNGAEPVSVVPPIAPPSNGTSR